MCTSIVEIARAEGMAKREGEWFQLSHAVVAYDHARHAPLGDVITLDFINTDLEPGARAGIELTLDTAKELRRARPGDRGCRVRGSRSEGAGFRGKSHSGCVTRNESCWRVSGFRPPQTGPLPANSRRRDFIILESTLSFLEEHSRIDLVPLALFCDVWPNHSQLGET